MISIMEGCSSMSQWSNIYELEGGIDTLKSTSLFIDPIQEFQRNDHQGSGVISWGGGAPNDLCTTTLPMNTMIIQSRPLDASNGGATSSVDRSLECLLSGTFSNTDTTSDEDDGISLLFSSNFNTNYLNFSYDNNNNNDNNSNNNSTKCNNNNNIYPRKRSHHYMHTIQENHPKTNSTTHNNNTTTTSGPKGNNKRQRQRYSPNNNNNLNARSKIQFSSNSSLNISFQQVGGSSGTALLGVNNAEPDAEAIQQMKEMIYRAAAFRPVNFGTEELEKPNKRKNVRISSDPQTVAARQRRERISERLRVLQKLVPGGNKMDTATMLDEAANYLKFLRNQVKDLENLGNYKLNNQHHYNSTSSFNQFSPNPSKNLQYLPMNP